MKNLRLARLLLVVGILFGICFWWRLTISRSENKHDTAATISVLQNNARPVAARHESANPKVNCDIIVETADGHAVAGAIVCNVDDLDKDDCRPSDDQGHIEVSFCSAWVLASGYQPRQVQLELGASATIVLTPFLSADNVSGIVRDIDGGRVSGALVVATSDNVTPLALSYTDGNGAFSIGVPRGAPVQLHVNLQGYSHWSDEVTAPTHVEIVLSAEACLSGKVVADDGVPVPKLDVVLTGLTPGARGAATTSNEGRFEICGLFPGEYELTTSHGKLSAAMQHVYLEASETREIVIDVRQGYTISGTLTQGGAPCRSGMVTVLGSSPKSMTTETGNYVTHALPPGSHRVSVRCANASQSKLLEIGTSDLRVDWAFAQGFELGGVVLNAPLDAPSLSIQVQAVDGSHTQRCPVAQGQFSCLDLPAATYEVALVTGDIQLSRRQNVEVRDNVGDVRLSAESTGSLSVFVVDTDGQPVSQLGGTARCSGGSLRFSETVGAGRLLFSFLPPGECTVSLDGVDEVQQTSIILPGQVTDLRWPITQRTIAGSVVDQEGHPVAGISMSLVSESSLHGRVVSSTRSDSDGHFILRAAVSEDALIVAQTADGKAEVTVAEHTRIGAVVLPTLGFHD